MDDNSNILVSPIVFIIGYLFMKTKIKLLLIIFAFQLSECQQPQAVSSPLATLEIPVSTPTEPIATSSATATLPLNNPTSTSILPDLEASLTPYEKNIYLPILLQFERCNLPCWWGIEPGETSWDDAVKVFEYLQVPVNSNWLKEVESFVPFQNQDINFHFALQVDHNDGIVHNIEIIAISMIGEDNLNFNKHGLPITWDRSFKIMVCHLKS